MHLILAQANVQPSTVDQVLSPYVYVFYVSFIVSFLFTPVMRAVAVFLGWIAGLAISQYLTLHRQYPGWPVPHPSVKFSIVMGGLIIVVLGLWDDVHGIKPIGK